MTLLPDRDNDTNSIISIYLGALDLPECEQTDYVQRMSSCDETAARVISLLARKKLATGFMATGLGVSKELTELQPSTTIGTWKIVNALGQGGMGDVYLVERIGDFQQTAALKLLSSNVGFAWEGFERERQILAQLTHPNLVQVIDGGITSGKQLYFVMEHVEGVTLIDYWSEQDSSLDTRLGLFADLCSVISYAHSNLVLHRDIKPSNILINAQGQLKLVDFGVSQYISDNPDFQNLPVTPRYAAPEVLSGESATVASEIFSLGLTLKALLISSEDFLTSRELDLNGVTTTVCNSKELTKIIQKACEQDPKNRYQSVTEIRQDILNVQNNYPIQAVPSTWAYTASKFVQRNKVASSLTILLCLSLIAGSLSIYRYAKESIRQRDLAVIAADTADERSLFADATSQVYADLTTQALILGDTNELDFAKLLDSTAENAIATLDQTPEQSRIQLYALSKLHERRGDNAALEKVVEPFYHLQDQQGRATHMSLQRFAMIKSKQGDMETGMKAFARAEKLMVEKEHLYTFDLANMRANRAAFSDDAELLSKTASQLEQAANTILDNNGSLHDGVHLLSQIGFLHFRQNEFESALNFMSRAYQVNQGIKGHKGTPDDKLLFPQVILLNRLGRFKDAMPLVDELISQAKTDYGPSVLLADRLAEKADLLIKLARAKESIEYSEQAINLLEKYDVQPSRKKLRSLESLQKAYLENQHYEGHIAVSKSLLKLHVELNSDKTIINELQASILQSERLMLDNSTSGA